MKKFFHPHNSIDMRVLTETTTRDGSSRIQNCMSKLYKATAPLTNTFGHLYPYPVSILLKEHAKRAETDCDNGVDGASATRADVNKPTKH